MLVRFWGTRGSLATPLNAAAVRGKMRAGLVAALERGLNSVDEIDDFIDHDLDFAISGTFGGNTSCVEIDDVGEDYFLCDLGTGVREFGDAFLSAGKTGRSKTFRVFLSHLHWDHIMGLPFFVPAYIPGHRIEIYSCHPNVERALRRQHGGPSFPVDFDQLGATINFNVLEPGHTYKIGGVTVRALLQYHEGDSYGWRFEHDGKVAVYSTDSEHKPNDSPSETTFAAFFADADLIVFDAMYSLADAVSLKQDWGHSSNVLGVELAQRAGARRLALFHHEPANDDAAIARVLADARRYEELSRDGCAALEVVSAYDGLEIAL